MPPKTRRTTKRPPPAQTNRPTRHSARRIAKSQTHHESDSEEDHDDNSNGGDEDINDDDKDLEHDSDYESANPSHSTKSKRKKNRKNFSEKEKNEVKEEMVQLQNSQETAQLPLKALLSRVGVNSSTWYRWQNKCQLCFEEFPVKQGSLVSYPNCEQKFCVGCLTNDFVRQLSQSQESEFLLMNSFQCSMCTVAHCFRPVSGYNGMKNICPNTDIFFENCEKTLKLGIDVITGMFHNMARRQLIRVARAFASLTRKICI